MSIRLKIQSFIANCVYWTFNFYRYNQAVELRDYHQLQLHTIEPTFLNVQRFMEKFKYKPDKWINWRPYILTYFARNMTGDCDDASIAGKWALRQIGIESRIISLQDSTGMNDGHAVCVSDNDDILITNSTAIKIKTNCLYAYLMRYFDNKYDIVKEM